MTLHLRLGSEFKPLLLHENVTGTAIAPSLRHLALTIDGVSNDETDDPLVLGDASFWKNLAGVTRVDVSLEGVHRSPPRLSLRHVSVLDGSDRVTAGVQPPWRRRKWQPLRELSVSATACEDCAGDGASSTVTVIGAAVSTLTRVTLTGCARLEKTLGRTGPRPLEMTSLRVLDLRGAALPFSYDTNSEGDIDHWRPPAVWRHDVRLPRLRGGAPALETMLLGYEPNEMFDEHEYPCPGTFNLFELTALDAPRLRRVVIERDVLRVGVPRAVSNMTSNMSNTDALGHAHALASTFDRELAAAAPP